MAGVPPGRELLLRFDGSACSHPERNMKPTWLHLLYLLYCAEAGVYLLLVPWSGLWPPAALRWAESIRPLLLAGAVLGAVSAFGFVLLAVGFVDLVRFCRALRSAA